MAGKDPIFFLQIFPYQSKRMKRYLWLH